MAPLLEEVLYRNGLLRSYTMLYPNYTNLSSLSTNRLGFGAHVRRLPRAIFDRKLPDVNASEVVGTGLLDLLEEEVIVKRGEERRLEVFGCTDTMRCHCCVSDSRLCSVVFYFCNRLNTHFQTIRDQGHSSDETMQVWYMSTNMSIESNWGNNEPESY
ncbi:hypothetical protein EI94DRAFT_1736912 [Lactarius quietus]|nr:hypothetical protein EI94DRAFT_1736912 [Lactarius quietus]